MAREFIVSRGWLATMLPPKLNFNQRDGIEVKSGLV